MASSGKDSPSDRSAAASNGGRGRPGRRVVIATLGSLGDLHPYLAVALGLQTRGHRPIIATSTDHRASVENAGLEFAPLGPEAPPTSPELYARILDPKKGLEFVFRELFMPAARHTYLDLQAAVSADGGSALLVSTPTVFAAPLLAAKVGVPWVSTVLAPLAFFSAHEPVILPGLPAALTSGPRWLRPWWGRAVCATARRLTRPWTRPLNELRQELELPPTPAHPLYEGQHSPQRVLAMFSGVLGTPRPDWPSRTLQTGFAYHDLTDDASTGIDPALARFLDAGPPPVVFTLGSTVVHAASDFYQVSVAAARRLGMRALLLVGRGTQNRQGLPQPLPEGVGVFDYAPYAAVFPRAAAVVHQGGIGTTAQALRAGCPVLVVPFNFDQPDNAARIARLGTGRAVSLSRYRASASGELGQLLNDAAIQRKAQVVAETLRGEDGVAAACDALERFL